MGKKFKNKDLAARLGVSGTLVSLVLNNKADQQGIRKDTQEKVLLLARQMGYFDSLHDKNESSPVEEKPGVLGMIVPSINDPFVIQITPFLQKAFSSIGVGFSIVTKDPDDQRYDRLVGAFKKFYTGLILLGDAADEATIRALRTTDYPFVLLEKPSKTLRLNTVSTDTVAGAQLIVNHLDKLGYKNLIIVADYKTSNSDRSAVQDIIETIRKKKLRVPQDIAVVSMEEGTGFDLMFSPVTCLRKPLSSISTKVANMIWSEVKSSGKGKFKRQVNISPELIVRNSCGTI